MDVWIGECLPCKWGSEFKTQDEAIRAAEGHVFTTHRDTTPTERANQFIGHVQLRAQNAIGFQESSQADSGTNAPTPLAGAGSGTAAPPVSSDQQPAPPDTGTTPAQ